MSDTWSCDFLIIEINIVYWKINTPRQFELLYFGDVGKLSEAMATFGNIGEFSEDSEQWELYIDRLQEYFAANEITNADRQGPYWIP